MKKTIENFCKNRENGLFLMNLPTGFGKTHNVLDFIVENYDKPGYSEKEFFFVTTLKKNLPYDKLRDRFVGRDREADFDRLCIKLEGNADVLIEKMEELHRGDVFPEHVRVCKEYQALLNAVCQLNSGNKKLSAEKNRDYAFSALAKDFDDNIRKKLEPEFRKKVVMAELDQFNTVRAKISAIRNNPNYQWIGLLYPAVFSKDKRIFFMTMDKFIKGNTTIVEPRYLFHNNPVINNAIVFIDEFDSTKERILNQLIEQGLNNHVDILELVDQFYSAIKTRRLPKRLLTDSKSQLEYIEKHPGTYTCREIVDGLKLRLEEVYERFFLQYRFRTRNMDPENKVGRNFLFNDLTFHSAFSNKGTRIRVVTDEEENQNWIEFVKEKPGLQKDALLNLLSRLKGLMSYLQIGCYRLADNYRQLKKEAQIGMEDDFSMENAVASVLREFSISEKYMDYLVPLIISEGVRQRRERRKKEESLDFMDRSVYNKGFRYYDFIDHPRHDMQSEIRLYDFPDSPEKILLCIAERANVVGISATASLDSVVGNFDLEYLQKMLGSAYYECAKEDTERLESQFRESIKNYKDVGIHVKSVSCTFDDMRDILECIFDDESYVDEFQEKVDIKLSEIGTFGRKQFLKIVMALKDFIANDDVKSFLCLSNRLAEENKGSFDIGLLRDFAGAIIEDLHKCDLNAEELIQDINTADFQKHYDSMIERLSSGKKLFVVSSYNSIGAGQNLQYACPEGLNLVKINDFNRDEKEKDFDCIYLEAPTHLLVNIYSGKELSKVDLIRSIYQVEFLMERGEVSLKDGVARIKDAFACYSGQAKFLKKKDVSYKTASINNYAIRILKQAVGRICRTSFKNKDVFIYVDDEVFKKYDLAKDSCSMKNPEFQSMIKFETDSVLKKPEMASHIDVFENRACRQSQQAIHIIKSYMYEWTERNIENWQTLREICLRHPTIDADGVNGASGNVQYKMLFAQMPTPGVGYSYDEQDDYSNVTVKFDNSLSKQVSESEVCLQELMAIPGVRELFEKNHYATTFGKKEFMLLPPMFNNIYKGALGEIIGKFMLERYIDGCHLKEMPKEYFELFDYDVGNGIYVDFKLWKDTMQKDAEELKQKILAKLEKCNGKRAVIINIHLAQECDVTTSLDGKIVEIPYLYRTDLKKVDETMIKRVMEYLR